MDKPRTNSNTSLMEMDFGGNQVRGQIGKDSSLNVTATKITDNFEKQQMLTNLVNQGKFQLLQREWFFSENLDGLNIYTSMKGVKILSD